MTDTTDDSTTPITEGGDPGAPQLVDFSCPDCGEELRGLEGSIARCRCCGMMQDAPYRDELIAPAE